MGYSEPSAFSHAFKRWSGRSPESWRRAARRALSPVQGRAAVSGRDRRRLDVALTTARSARA